MSLWKRELGFFLERTEREVDWILTQARRGLGLRRPTVIEAYMGYGRHGRIYLRGRVLEKSGVRSAEEGDTAWDNLRMMYRRVASHEIAGAVVRGQFNGTGEDTVTNAEGFFEFDTPVDPAPDMPGLWREVPLRLIKPEPQRKEDEVRVTGNVLVPPPGVQFGVISDLDDTVIHSDVRSLVKMVRLISLNNARTRMPFAGVAAFYRALHQGGGAESQGNPIFYVSSSPWNVYYLLRDFLMFQQIPLGPIMLRDWGVSRHEFLPTSHHNYKRNAIRHILDFYQNLPFLLIGDSSQEDPEIYSSIVADYKGRIRAVYIRNVTADLIERKTAIDKLAGEVLEAGSSLHLVPDTYSAALHAAENGWISPDVLGEVRGETVEDKAAPANEATDILDESQDLPSKAAQPREVHVGT